MDDQQRGLYTIHRRCNNKNSEPSYDSSGKMIGYHSNRRVPDRAAVDAVRELYRKLRAEEGRHSSAPAGLDASWRLLQDFLAERGQTYDEFVWDLTNGGRS